MDLKEVHVGPTRGTRSIDRLFCNIHRAVEEAGTVPPLETEAEEAAKSDHLVAFTKIKLLRQQKFERFTYSYCGCGGRIRAVDHSP